MSPVPLLVAAVAAALAAALFVCIFQVLRAVGMIKKLRASLEEFRGEAEPIAQAVVEVAEEIATRAEGLAGRRGAR
jgi:methyl coenzyme M reductase beta subunit